jgi:hypothetical protein
MTPEQLLAQLRPLSHGQRIRRMVEVGREARTDAAMAATLAALRAGDDSERWLALQACHGTRDGAQAVAALADQSARVRRLAVDLIPVICDDPQVQAALEIAPPRERCILIRRLAHRGRRAPIDTLVSSTASRSARELMSLLPMVSPATIEAHLPSILDQADVRDWHRLARWHLDIAVRLLRERVAISEGSGVELASIANGVLRILVRRAPDAALALVDDLVPHISPSDLELQALAMERPVEMADRVLRWNDRANVLFTWLAHRLDRGRFRALIERGFVTLGDRDCWLPRLPLEWRLYLADVVEPGEREVSDLS